MIKKTKIILDMIKFQHTVFALPFAFMGAVLPGRGFPPVDKIIFILIAMIGARSAGMSLNRLIDAEIDRHNPRTKNRPIQRNAITKGQVLIFTLINIAIFLYASYMLNPLAFKLSFPALAVLIFYPYTKRFTWGAHFFLGGCLSFAPIGGWIAVRGSVDLVPLMLMFAVGFWAAGFDILYSLQDIEHDREFGTFSIPAKMGAKNALLISRVLHFMMFSLLLSIKFIYGLGWLYLTGVIITGISLIYEQSMVKADDFSKVDAAFFNVNGVISVALFILTLLDVTLL